MIEIEFRLPSYKCSSEAIDKTKSTVLRDTYAAAYVPEEIMNKVSELLGDGRARVTVSQDMSLKEYGNGASAMVSVSVSCNQDDETIEKAINICGEIARSHAAEQRALAEKALKEFTTSDKANY